MMMMTEPFMTIAEKRARKRELDRVRQAALRKRRAEEEGRLDAFAALGEAVAVAIRRAPNHPLCRSVTHAAGLRLSQRGVSPEDVAERLAAILTGDTRDG